MNTHNEITIIVRPSSPQKRFLESDGDDDGRWETEQSPCFPRPMCVAVPPRRPDRQVSVATDPNIKPRPLTQPQRQVTQDSAEEENPKKPSSQGLQRIGNRANKLSFAQVPHRHAVPPLPMLGSLDRLPSHDNVLTDTIEEGCDEDVSCCEDLSAHFNESIRFDGSSSRMNESISRHNESSADLMDRSSRDSFPALPQRQRTVFVEDEEEVPEGSCVFRNGTLAEGAETRFQPDWVKLWESQGEAQFGSIPLSDLGFVVGADPKD